MKEEQIIENIIRELEKQDIDISKKTLLFYQMFYLLGDINITLFKTIFSKLILKYLENNLVKYTYNKKNKILTMESDNEKLMITFYFTEKSVSFNELEFYPTNKILYSSANTLEEKEELMGLNDTLYYFSYHNPDILLMDKNGYLTRTIEFDNNGNSVYDDVLNLSGVVFKNKADNMIIYSYIKEQIKELKKKIKSLIENGSINEDIYINVALLENYIMLSKVYEKDIKILDEEYLKEQRNIVSRIVVNNDKVVEKYFFVVKDDAFYRNRKK